MAGTFSYNQSGIAATYNCTHIWTTVSGVFSLNLVGTNFEFFSPSSTIDDAVYFAYNVWGPSEATLELNIATAISGIGLNLEWEYYTTGPWQKWVPLSESGTVVDETNGLTTTGQHKVRFGRPAMVQGNGVTINGTTVYFIIRARITAGTVTNGGQCSTSITPRFYDGLIRPSGWSAAAPFTLDDVYTWTQANAPEITFTKTPTNEQTYNQAVMYNMENASLYTDQTEATAFKMANCTYSIGNGSLLYMGILGGYFTDGERVGDFGYNGSTIIVRFMTYGGATAASSNSKFYGTVVKPGTYRQTLAGTLMEQPGFAYFNMSGGEYIGCVWDGISNGYIDGVAEIKNSYLRSGFYVMNTLPATTVLDNCYIYHQDAKPTGIFGMYGKWSGDGGYFKNVKWQLPTGSCLFHPGWNAPHTLAECHYRWLNPSPALPKTFSSVGGVGLLYTTGYGDGSSLDNPWHINEYFEIDITTLDINGNVLVGSEVKIYDKDDTLVTTLTTDENGQIATYDLMTMDAYFDQVNNIPVIEDFNPFKIVVTRNLCDTYQTIFSVNTKTYLPITLTFTEIEEQPIQYLPLPEGYGQLTGPLGPGGEPLPDNPMGGDAQMNIGMDEIMLRDAIQAAYMGKTITVPYIKVEGQTVTNYYDPNMAECQKTLSEVLDEPSKANNEKLAEAIAYEVITHIKDYAATVGATDEILFVNSNVQSTIDETMGGFTDIAGVVSAIPGGTAITAKMAARVTSLTAVKTSLATKSTENMSNNID